MTFLLVVKIILLIASLFFAVCSIGANEPKNGERCVCLATMFATALIALMAFGMVYGQ